MTRTSTDPLVGDVLDGRYEVLQRLARGGMATVYRAWDRRLERIVAIKVMHEGLGDDADFAAKFDREARAAARLCDQNVVTIFDQGQDYGRPYIVMEFVEGTTLRGLITRDAPMSPLRALQLIEPVAAALAVAHDSGLVHRDVKPENVLISDRGAIKVADFGLARTITGQSAAAATQGLLIGTVSYLPPELVITGKAHAWSDIYSTGIVLFEMLTGTKPYVGDTPITVAYKHAYEDVPPPSVVLVRDHPQLARRDPIPDYVDALVQSCTRRNPAARPADGRDLLSRVRRARRSLERGVRHDDALCAVMFPGKALPWSAEATEVLSPDATATSVLPRSPAAPDAIASASPSGTTGGIRTAATTVADARPTPWTRGDARPGNPVSPMDPDSGRIRERVTASAATATGRPLHSRALAAAPASRSTPTEYPDPRYDAGLASGPANPGGYDRFPRLTQSQVHRRRRGLVFGFLVVVLTLTVGFGSWWLASGRYVATPSVINRTQSEAQAIADANGLDITFVEEHDETVPVGLVIRSDPGPGVRVTRDTTVTAVVSSGPERFGVPKLVGLTLDAATSALASSSLQTGTVTEVYDDTTPAGTVVAAGYREGEQVRRDTAVDLSVSKGREPIAVPSVVGQPVAQATKTLQDAGFTVVVGEERSDDKVAAGSVISQSPAGGNGYRGDTVTIVVSKGAEKVKVPDGLTGQDTQDAVKTLQDAGFDVTLEYTTSSPIRLNRVVSTDPAAGTELAKGSHITVYAI
ncbi:Stk1 family PASTA domain-containing Ser/Thr kinase [Brooklawnia cerclae]|uniref:non-specific serine/threonine protein kinase n=1 Tax=Brooklawnia cerclae TaxID=349934 RepID=A0ABX0SGR4_9ACTN|nr:serine/threonine-protein kinase [Brooklawnia cerclae]